MATPQSATVAILQCVKVAMLMDTKYRITYVFTTYMQVSKTN